MKKENKNIPFRQFIEKYNFCDFDIDNNHDTQIIRICLNDVYDSYDTCSWSDTWFELGINNFSDKKGKMIEKIFSNGILNSYVTNMRVLSNGTLCIELSKNEVDDD